VYNNDEVVLWDQTVYFSFEKLPADKNTYVYGNINAKHVQLKKPGHIKSRLA
jgi:hypothetical protein